MSKLSLDALKMRAEAVASEELLASINGGTENECHPAETAPAPAPAAPAAPAAPSVSHEIKVNVSYGPSGWSIGGGYTLKF